MKVIFKILIVGGVMWSTIACCDSSKEFTSNQQSSPSVQDTKYTKIVSGARFDDCVYVFEYNGHEYLVTPGFIYHSESCKCRK
jgi:hypothetical protein